MMEEILDISTTGDIIFYRTPRDRILNIYYIIIYIFFFFFNFTNHVWKSRTASEENVISRIDTDKILTIIRTARNGILNFFFVTSLIVCQ